jgi:hypothetical protein
MSVRISLALAASLFVVAFGISTDVVAAAAAGRSAATNWNDATLDATKVDYFFKTMDKFLDYVVAHPEFDLDTVAMDGNESEADYARRASADPKLRKIFDATGIDPAHYANASGVLMGSMLGVGLAGKIAEPSKLPQAAQYYLAHKAQIEARMAAYQEKGKAIADRMGADDDSE